MEYREHLERSPLTGDLTGRALDQIEELRKINRRTKEEKLMNTIITSKEAILEGSRRLIQKEGPAGMSIRKLAKSMNISTGSIYYYFPSKNSLLCSAVESVWTEIFDDYAKDRTFADAVSCVKWIFACLREGENRYPGFLELHSKIPDASSDDPDALMAPMKAAWKHLRLVLEESLKVDPAFSNRDSLSCALAAKAVFSLILSSVFLRSMSEKDVLDFMNSFMLD